MTIPAALLEGIYNQGRDFSSRCYTRASDRTLGEILLNVQLFSPTNNRENYVADYNSEFCEAKKN